MKATDLATLVQFMAKHSLAWETFAANAQELIFTDFEFVQARGSWVLTDDDGNEHAFREYRNEIIAISSETGNYVILGVEVISL